MKSLIDNRFLGYLLKESNTKCIRFGKFTPIQICWEIYGVRWEVFVRWTTTAPMERNGPRIRFVCHCNIAWFSHFRYITIANWSAILFWILLKFCSNIVLNQTNYKFHIGFLSTEFFLLYSKTTTIIHKGIESWCVLVIEKHKTFSTTVTIKCFFFFDSLNLYHIVCSRIQINQKSLCLGAFASVMNTANL